MSERECAPGATHVGRVDSVGPPYALQEASQPTYDGLRGAKSWPALPRGCSIVGQRVAAQVPLAVAPEVFCVQDRVLLDGLKARPLTSIASPRWKPEIESHEGLTHAVGLK